MVKAVRAPAGQKLFQFAPAKHLGVAVMGRKKKVRPNVGDPITKGMSERDIAATGTLTRRQIQDFKKLAEIPEEEFEAMINVPDSVPSTHRILVETGQRKVAQRRTSYCPHCGGKLP